MTKYKMAKRNQDELLDHLLEVRGVADSEQESFLNPDYETGRHDPFLLNDMQVAVDRIMKAIDDNERITIYSDYDCDGIPGAVVLHDFFKAVGFDNFTNYIPHRHFEGFGLNKKAVDKIAEDGTDLIITIDCGTSDKEAAQSVSEAGMELIVTDHHEPPEQLPKAVAIVNPRVGSNYPFPHLCGAAVVFKLAEALLSTGKFSLKLGKEKWWLDMVALATVGDMVPLVGENRVLAHWGLAVLRKSRRPGLQKLLRQARADQRRLTEDDIGFTIAPRINAASRMDTPEDAFLMLSLDDVSLAGARAERLHKLNNERKGIVASMTKELKKRMSEMVDIPKVLVLGNPEWRPSLVGLCANSLADEYSRPVFLWGRDGNGVIKGSCRSGGEVSLVKLMEAASKYFSENGGHHAAGGFSVKEESIYQLPQALNDVYDSLGNELLNSEEVVVDSQLSLSEVNDALVRTLQKMAPYGIGNPKPIFAFAKVAPNKVEQFGKNKEHLKLMFDNGSRDIEAIAFFSKAENYQKAPKVGEPITLLAQVEESFFMGRRQVRLRIVDIIDSL